MTVRTTMKAGLIAALVALPMIATAQTEGESGGASDVLPLGTTVEQTQGDRVGATYVAQTHGDWEMRCIRQDEGQPEPCQLYQLLVDDNGGPVAEFNVFDLPDEGQVVAGATIVTPLDTLLPPGIRLRVDDGAVQQYPFAFCQQIGCFARLGLSSTNLDALRRGGEAHVAIVPLPAPDQQVELTASLIGFTAAFEALEAHNAEARALIEAQAAEEGNAASD